MTVVRRVAVLLVWMVIGIAVPVVAQNTTTRVSVTSTGAQTTFGGAAQAISADGRFLVFHTQGALVPSDTNDFENVYLYDRLTATLGAGQPRIGHRPGQRREPTAIDQRRRPLCRLYVQRQQSGVRRFGTMCQISSCAIGKRVRRCGRAWHRPAPAVPAPRKRMAPGCDCRDQRRRGLRGVHLGGDQSGGQR